MRKHVWLRVQKEDEPKRSGGRKVIYEFVNFPNLLPQPKKADEEWNSTATGLGNFETFFNFWSSLSRTKKGTQAALGKY